MDGLTRREALVAGGAAAAAFGMSGSRLARAVRRGAPPHAVVVGAGLSGLVCAERLQAAGWRVTVLEARPRIGGRVLTIRAPFGGGQHAEAGGEFIDRNHSRMRALVHRLGLRMEDVRRGFGGLEDVGYRDGRRRPFRAYAPGGLRREIARFSRALVELSASIDPVDPVASARADALDARSAADLIDELGIDGHARMLLSQYLRDDYGVEPESLSLLHVAQAERLYRGVPAGGIEQFRVRGGNDQVAGRLAARLSTPVALGVPVTAISQTPAGIAIEAGDMKFEARRCVVAVPPAALRGVAFDPALPPALAGAIADLQYARVSKRLLSYERRVWRRHELSGTAYTDLAVATIYEATDQQPGRRGILISYAAGDLSPPVERLTQHERVRRARAGIDRVFPGTARRFTSGASAAWATQRESRGAWCSYAPGQVTAYWRAIRAPAGRIHFAGEQTSAFTGYMEGAVRSGERAAAELLAAGP